MKVLFCGDIVGRSGREVVVKHLPKLRKELGLDLVVVNAENAAGGFGITATICQELYDAGTDIISTGNHIWDQKEIIAYIDSDPRLLRPVNYSNQKLPGRGIATHTLPNGKKVIVINLMTRLFMADHLDCPFVAIEEILKSYPLNSSSIAGIIIDAHGEANSEKMAIAQMVDGKATLVVGSHTHIPSADHQILTNGTAYQTDAGMCGDYDSVIGMAKDIPIARFKGKVPIKRMEPALGEATLCGTYIEANETTGLATYISPVRIDGKLSQHLPKQP